MAYRRCAGRRAEVSGAEIHNGPCRISHQTLIGGNAHTPRTASSDAELTKSYYISQPNELEITARHRLTVYPGEFTSPSWADIRHRQVTLMNIIGVTG